MSLGLWHVLLYYLFGILHASSPFSLQEVTREPCRAPAFLRPLPLPFSGLRPGSFPGPVFSSRLLSLALCDLLFSVSENSFILFNDFVSLFPRLLSFSISPPSDVSGFADVRAPVFPASVPCAPRPGDAAAPSGSGAPGRSRASLVAFALAADPSSGSCPPPASRPLPSLPLLPVLLHMPRDVAASHESIFFTFLGLQRFLF